MKQTVGRYLLQPDKNFPVDCETLDTLQSNIALAQVLGNIVGDKTILLGCALEQTDTRRAPGYVFARTADFPDGEVIYWEGGNVSTGMYLKQEVVPGTAQGDDFPAAYTTRSLAPGVGTENFDWDDFVPVRTAREAAEREAEQDAAIALLAPPPLGVVQTWAGKNVPAGYALCEGQQLQISEYPALYGDRDNVQQRVQRHRNAILDDPRVFPPARLARAICRRLQHRGRGLQRVRQGRGREKTRVNDQ